MMANRLHIEKAVPLIKRIGMTLLEKALEISKRPHVLSLDAAWAQEMVVKKRLQIVCQHVAKLFRNAQGNEISADTVEQEPLSGGDSFGSMNPADIALLVFEVIAERNRNTQLWNQRGPGGIDDEIQNTIAKFFKGPSVLSGDLSQGIRESTYSGAKRKLIENLESRMF